jgi:hypothetical protein
MRLDMRIEIPAVREPLAADLTLIWGLARVATMVCLSMKDVSVDYVQSYVEWETNRPVTRLRKGPTAAILALLRLSAT